MSQNAVQMPLSVIWDFGHSVCHPQMAASPILSFDATRHAGK